MLDTFKYYFLFSSRLLREVNPVFLFFLVPFSLFAQENLVPNGDFEEFVTCPSSDPPYYFVDRAAHWFMPSLGSSDYFNACSTEFDSSQNTFLFSVPQNYEGYQNALSGVGYAGYYAAIVPTNDNYYEYVSVRLTRSLEKDKLYKLTYYLSLADSAYKGGRPQQFVDHSGGYFSKNQLSFQNDSRIDVTPQIYSTPGIMLDDSLGWQKVEGEFFAEGGEQYLTIGYFFPYDKISFNFSLPPDDYVSAYYYLDDVSLIETDIFLPNVITPNGDGVNDTAFVFPGFSDVEIDILNRWGDLVVTVDSSVGWSGNDKFGKEMVDGVYFYVIRRRCNNIKNGFIQLMR